MPASTLSWAALLAFVSLQAAQRPVEDKLPEKNPAITRAELEHHVRFLASDELGGRAPLTAGMERAAQYLAHALAASGVEPAGDGGTFFQDTGFVRLEYPKVPRLVFTDESGQEVEAHYGVDFTLRVRGTAHSTAKLPLRFFYDYNNSRMPKQGNAQEAIYFSASKVDKKRILEEKGIPSLEDWGLEIEVMPGDKGQEPGQTREELASRVVSGTGPEACELVELRGALLTPFERRSYTHVQLLIDEVAAPFQDHNVIGRIRGAGTKEHPELAQEVVVLSAHYDHLGLNQNPRAKEREDQIFNGADDDASGCAALLELAQAFAAGPPPARSLIVFFATGEERGETGSKKYLAAPVEPLARTVADLNLEMLGRPDELVGGPGHLWLAGYERTNLGPRWHELGLPIVDDPRPEQRFFQRSDNFAFALKGVVALTLSSFALHKEYHTVRDEADTLDYAHLEAAANVAFRAAQTLADGSILPAWVEGQQPKEHEPAPKTAPKTDEERAAERAQRKAEKEAREKDGKGEEPKSGEPKGG